MLLYHTLTSPLLLNIWPFYTVHCYKCFSQEHSFIHYLIISLGQFLELEMLNSIVFILKLLMYTLRLTTRKGESLFLFQRLWKSPVKARGGKGK